MSKQSVHVKIGGRIPAYYFGVVRPELREELQKALEHVDEDLEEVGDVLQALHEMSLEWASEAIERFKEGTNWEGFEADCPQLAELVTRMEEEGMGHYAFYDEMFTSPNQDLIFIEEDAHITITIDGEEVVSNQRLSEYLGEAEYADLDDDEALKADLEAMMTALTPQLGFPSAEDYDIDERINVSRAASGALLMSSWMEPPAYMRFKDEDEYYVTIDHDDIVDYHYYFDCESFEPHKLRFLSLGGAEEIRHSAEGLVANYVVYGDELLDPERDWYRDKGITLHYEDSGMSLGLLIEG